MRRYPLCVRRALLALGLGSVVACGTEGDLTVRLTLHESDLYGIRVLAVPIDVNEILDSLMRAASVPPPTFEDLETALFAFEPSDDEALSTINAPWLALADSVAALSDTLYGMDRATPEYAVAYERFRVLYAALTRRTVQRDRELLNLDGNAVKLARWAQAAVDTLRTWERGAFQAYDSVAAAAVARSGRDTVTAVTDGHGEAHLGLAPGTWWIVARIPDRDNPFLEYTWNTPVRVSTVVPTHMTLSERHAVHRWRH